MRTWIYILVLWSLLNSVAIYALDGYYGDTTDKLAQYMVDKSKQFHAHINELKSKHD